MGKYIIELPDDEHLISWWTYTGTEDGKQHIDFHEVVKTPYDLDAIRKEAYAEGYKEGMQLSIDDAKLKKEYQRGLNDAWDAAKKIWEYDATTLKKIFSKCCYSVDIWDILHKYSASEAIEKIKQCGQKQEEIEYGDEIQFCDGVKALVLDVDDEKLSVVTKRGFTDISMWKGNVTKTGEKYIIIADYLRKIRDGYEF